MPTAEQSVQQRVDELRRSPEFRAYLEARAHVLRMKDDEGRDRQRVYAPSEYWTEELANFDYLLDASPLIIAKLRHHSYHVTGLKVYDYRTHRDRQHERLAEKLRVLIELGGRELLVPEARLMGGFGFEIN